MHAVFPQVKNPQEASYFAIGMATMPDGMIGLLISGIFAATMGQMDTGLNRNAGYFIKNFYQVQLRPKASERELLFASKIATVAFGGLIILAGLWFASIEGLTIFKLMVNFGAWVGVPVAIPLIWGMFLRKTPSWAAWSSVLVGLATSYLTQQFLNAEWIGRLMGFVLSKREASDWGQAAGIIMNVVVGSAWFVFAPMLIKSRRPVDEVKRVDHFFNEMHTPVDFEKEEGPGSDNVQAKLMGTLCLIYGSFMLLLMLIPNPLKGRLCFLFCGGCMFGVGALLYRAGTKHGRRGATALPGGSVIPPPFVDAQPGGFEVVATQKETIR
jgi:hypothetical protein